MNHSFDIQIAEKIGIECSILLQHIGFWHQKNVGNNKNYHDGYYWTYNSIKGFKLIFSYLTERKIRSALDRLEEKKLIVKGNYNKSNYDRTKWYALTKEGCKLMDIQIMSEPFDDLSNGMDETSNPNQQNGEPIPDINTGNNTENSSLLFLKSLTSTRKKIVSYIFVVCEKAKVAYAENPKKLKPYSQIHANWMSITSDEDLKDRAFEFFWEIYQRKDTKDISRRKFKSLTWLDIYHIFYHVPEYVKSTPDKSLRCMAKTYLNEKRWKDEEIVANLIKKADPKLIEAVESGNYLDRFNADD